MSTAAAWLSGWATDPGRERSVNEDCVWVDDARGVFLIVDGLGGHAAGEKAATTAVEAITRTLDLDSGRVEEQVRRAITAANNDIYRLAVEHPDWLGMACVLTLAVIHGDSVTFGHVGDSRLYLLWNGALKKLTSDHSPVGELEDEGELTEAEAMTDPRRNEIFRDVGSRPRGADDEDFIEIRTLPLRADAGLLLCSDGLTDALATAEIAAIIERYDGDPERVAVQLVEAANAAGGRDNVSVVLVAGPEFIGVHSPAMTSARARHAVTRMRPRRRAWRTIAGRAVWLLLGLLLGMALLALLQRVGQASCFVPLSGERGLFPAGAAGIASASASSLELLSTAGRGCVRTGAMQP